MRHNFVIEVWSPVWNPGKWTATGAWWSLPIARADAAHRAAVYRRPYRVITEDGTEHGRFTGET